MLCQKNGITVKKSQTAYMQSNRKAVFALIQPLSKSISLKIIDRGIFRENLNRKFFYLMEDARAGRMSVFF